jgi:hypothetical protein
MTYGARELPKWQATANIVPNANGMDFAQSKYDAKHQKSFLA